jgi:hypothetical protein
MTEAQQIAVTGIVAMALFIECAYLQRKKLSAVLKPVLFSLLPNALLNPAPRVSSKELRALERRTQAKKRQASQDKG